MVEELLVTGQTKEEIYTDLLPQIKALLSGEKNRVANLANCAAALRQAFDFWWVGFYLVEENELVLGPFQGPIACTRIAKGKGVCGSSWEREETILVEDVEAFPGHIACSSASKSEIVVPIKKNNKVVAVLDVDSEHYAHFNTVDQAYLEDLCAFLGKQF